jgi:hypothetical protein
VRRKERIRKDFVLTDAAEAASGATAVAALQGDAKKATIGANYASIFVCHPISRLSASRAWTVAAPA